jgi:hypothetical protein
MWCPLKKCPLVEVHEIYGFHFKNLTLLIKFENIHFSYILFFSTKTYNICNIHQKRLFHILRIYIPVNATFKNGWKFSPECINSPFFPPVPWYASDLSKTWKETKLKDLKVSNFIDYIIQNSQNDNLSRWKMVWCNLLNEYKLID